MNRQLLDERHEGFGGRYLSAEGFCTSPLPVREWQKMIPTRINLLRKSMLITEGIKHLNVVVAAGNSDAQWKVGFMLKDTREPC